MSNITHPKSRNIPEDLIAHEKELVWLYEPQLFPFVRQSLAARRTGRIPTKCSPDRLIVGYTRSVANYRREFWVRPYDGILNSELLVLEAVDPLTLAPGITGQVTARCHIPMALRSRRLFARIFAKKNERKPKLKRRNCSQ